MTFGFPARFTESRTFNHQQDELASAVKSALDSLVWRYEILSDTEFRAGVSISSLSWGEKLKVEILQGGVVHVESKCAYPLQCFDWGKNKENVSTFLARVEQMKGRGIVLAAFEETTPAFDEKGHSPVERVLNEQNE